MQGSSKPESTSSLWYAELDLRFSFRQGKTVLSHRQQKGPLTIQRAFYPEGDVCHVYILHPPGGVAGGDNLTIGAVVKAYAHTLLTTPGATKFYRSEEKVASQTQKLVLLENACLEWLPQENIYFPGAEVEMTTNISLTANSRFIGWDTHCFGLPANNKTFSAGKLRLSFSLSKGNKPVLIEKMNVSVDRLKSPTGLRGNSVISMFIATPASEDALQLARELLDEYEQEMMAATLIEDCLIVRYLGNSTAQSRKIFSRLWVVLRPEVMGRKASLPRIWST